MGVMEYIVSLAMLAYTQDGVGRSTYTLRPSYDFIVVGGGSAGAIVASRLSENPAINVLLLDSGGSSSTYTDIPYTYLYSFPSMTSHVLKCFGADQPRSGACWQGQGNYCQVCESRILGGGSAINGFTFVRGTRVDFDGWAREGATGWSYDDLLIDMNALETFDRPSSGRGTWGPIHVTEEGGDYFNLQDTWLAAGRELGYTMSPDLNSETTPTGFGRAQNNVYNGERQTTDNVFLKSQQRQRPNLHIRAFSHVTRVLFDGDRAVGVEFVQTGDFSTKFTARATKEIILSAGAIQTPHILIHSGVGPRDQLIFLGVTHVAELEGVGQNLQDHPFLHMIQFATDTLNPKFGRATPSWEDWYTWVNHRTGPLATGSSSGLALLPTSYSYHSNDPRIELALSGNMHAKVILNAPKSRGQVRVRTRSPYDGSDPYVKLNLLDEAEDVESMMEGARALLRVLQTNAFKGIGARPTTPTPSVKGTPCTRRTTYGVW